MDLHSPSMPFEVSMLKNTLFWSVAILSQTFCFYDFETTRSIVLVEVFAHFAIEWTTKFPSLADCVKSLRKRDGRA